MKLNRLTTMPVWMSALVLFLGAEVAIEGGASREAFAAQSSTTQRQVDIGLLEQRTISLALENVTLEKALDEIASRARARLIYSRDHIPLEKVVSINLRKATVQEALAQVLTGENLHFFLGSNGQIVVANVDASEPAAEPPEPLPAEGTVVGRVTDEAGEPVAGANVMLSSTEYSARTGDDGRYRIGDVPAGTYTLLVQHLGFAEVRRNITISDGAEVRADIALHVSALPLDELVVTGTMVPTEVRAVPTPVTIISENEIAAQRPTNVRQIFRQAVPTSVAWDMVASPTQTTYSVRGTSMIGSGGRGQMKVFIDGIPVANNTGGIVDPNSVERIEIVRGPQAAALYGSDALGGVIQIFTKRGDRLSDRPKGSAEASLGVMQTPYDGYERVLRQSYKASVFGGSGNASYNFGASYMRFPDWVQEVTAQSNPSAYGGVQLESGPFSADLSARYYSHRYGAARDPSLASTGFNSVVAPLYRQIDSRLGTLAARLGVVAAPWWTHSLTAGVDRRSLDGVQLRPRLVTPDDTLLRVSQSENNRVFVEYSTTVQGALTRGVTGSLVVGIDHYDQVDLSSFTSGASRTTGRIPSVTPFSVSRVETDNTGYFAQGQLALHDQLFLTAGLRAEQNTHFGDSLSAPLSPRVGVSYARDLGSTATKVRVSWGRAIRPPDPGDKIGGQSGEVLTLPNPLLGPERQEGWDAGIDLHFASLGSLSITYFHQTAFGLIQSILLDVADGSEFTYQHQNVGRVRNTGVEVEASTSVGPVRIRGHYGYQKSRILDLGPNYSGDLEVGDEASLAIPPHTAGLSLTAQPRAGTAIAAGLTYAGSFKLYDIRAVYSCFGGTAPCRPGPGLRNYITSDPGWTKINLSITQDLSSALSGFVAIDNVTNSYGHEFTQFIPVIGRTTMFGLQLRY